MNWLPYLNHKKLDFQLLFQNFVEDSWHDEASTMIWYKPWRNDFKIIIEYLCLHDFRRVLEIVDSHPGEKVSWWHIVNMYQVPVRDNWNLNVVKIERPKITVWSNEGVSLFDYDFEDERVI